MIGQKKRVEAEIVLYFEYYKELTVSDLYCSSVIILHRGTGKGQWSYISLCGIFFY